LSASSIGQLQQQFSQPLHSPSFGPPHLFPYSYTVSLGVGVGSTGTIEGVGSTGTIEGVGVGVTIDGVGSGVAFSSGLHLQLAIEEAHLAESSLGQLQQQSSQPLHSPSAFVPQGVPYS